MDEPMLSRTIGRVTLTVREEEDCYPDLSYLGECCDLPSSIKTGWVYSRATGGVTRDGVTWHDAAGRFVSAKDSEQWHERNTYGWVRVDCGQDTCAQAISDAECLLRHGDSWYSVGLVASVRLAGREVGAASCWGYASDETDYLAVAAHDLGREALCDAIDWKESVA